MSSQGAAAHSARHGAHVPLQNTGTCLRQFKRILPLLSTLSTDATAAIFSLSFNEESGKVVTSCRNHARAAAAASATARARVTALPRSVSALGLVFVDRYLEGQF